MDELVPTATIVVASHRPSPLLSRCVSAALDQDPVDGDVELLVVLNGEGSGSDWSAPRGDPRVRIFREARGDLNRARNIGVANARAPIVCFLDHDAVPARTWLRALVGGLEAVPEAWCAGGAMILEVGLGWCRRENFLGSHFDLGGEQQAVPFLMGGNLAARRWVFDRAGPFREDLGMYGSDWEWEQRVRSMGGSLLYVDAPVEHVKRDLTRRDVVRVGFRRGYESAHVEPGPYPWGEALGFVVRETGHWLRRRCWAGLGWSCERIGQMLAQGFLHRRRSLRAGPKSRP